MSRRSVAAALAAIAAALLVIAYRDAAGALLIGGLAAWCG
jgi:hypothetical protein